MSTSSETSSDAPSDLPPAQGSAAAPVVANGGTAADASSESDQPTIAAATEPVRDGNRVWNALRAIRPVKPPLEVEIIEDDPEPYTRTPGDKLRVAVAAVVFIAALLAAAVLRSLVSGAEQDVIHLTGLVPEGIANILIRLGQYLGFLAPVALVVVVISIRRLRVAIMALVACLASVAVLYIITRALSVTVVLPASLGQLRGIGYPGPNFLAMGAAAVTVVGPWCPRFLRRVGVGTVAFVAFTRIVSQANVPYDVLMATALGWLTGAIVVAIFGSPNRHPAGADVVAALERAGVEVRRIELKGRGVRGSTMYLADTKLGERRFVKVFSNDQRDADLLLQVYRWLRLRDASDERPFSSLRRAVEHEALIALKAESDGIPTAAFEAVAEVDPEGMILAFEYIDGYLLEGAGESIPDDVLRRTWLVALAMQDRHIAHRDLNLNHVLVDHDGVPRIVDFSFSELSAHETQLRTDIAELLCATAAEVGAERAVAAAVAVMGKARIADALGRVQPLALTRHTRRAVAAHEGLLDQVQEEVQRATGVEEVHYEELARFSARKIVGLAVGFAALYFLLPQFADIGGIWQQVKSANWLWLFPVVIFQSSTYLGAGLGMVGSIPDRVPLLPTIRTQVAAAFVDVLAPAGLGGMALNTRFMQKRGIDPGVAVAGAGVNALGGVIGHVLLLGGFLLWAGSSSLDGATTGSQPVAAPWRTLLLIGLAVLVLAVIAWIVPAGRHFIRTRLVPGFRDALAGLSQLARRPTKLVAVITGSMIVTLGFTLAFVCTVEAFGGDVSVAQLGVAYLAAWAVAVFFPTPGGLGALEIALIAALGRLGVDSQAAVSSVLVFRFFTFWLPVAPGWFTFHWLQRHAEI